MLAQNVAILHSLETAHVRSVIAAGRLRAAHDLMIVPEPALIDCYFMLTLRRFY